MKNLFKKFASLSVGLTMLSASVSGVWAAESPVIELSFDGKNYEAGDIATAEVIVYNTSYNVLGFSLSYGDNVTVVDKNGEISDVDDLLIRMEDVMYQGEGIYSILSCDVTEDNIKTTVYVNPGSKDEDVENNSVSADENGRKVATISFKMTEAGVPDVDFATIEGDTEFATTPFFMLEGGTQPAGSKAQIRYNGTDTQPETDQQKDENSDGADETPDKSAQPEQDVVVSTTVSDDDPTVTGGEGTDINDVPVDPATDPADTNEPADGEEKELTATERFLGIAVIGVAFGVVGGLVLKKIMAGAKKQD